MEGDRGQWIYYGSPLRDYGNIFEGVLGETSMESLVLGKAEPPVILDILSPISKALRESFGKMKGENKLGIAVSLSDLRPDKLKKADEELGLHQIAGDITKSSTWDEISCKLGDRKADLIISRGGEGLLYIPSHPKFYAIMVNKMWSFLNLRGRLLLQVRHSDIIESWINHLNSRSIEASYLNFLRYGSMAYPVLSIYKGPDSPSELPF